MIGKTYYRRRVPAWVPVATGASGLAILGLCCTVSGTAPIPTLGPAVSGNEPPTLTITEPVEDVSVEQSGELLIRWSDTDRDSSAVISFDLVDVSDPGLVIPLVGGLMENDLDDALRPTPEEVSAPSGGFPGRYHLRGTISDSINAPVETFATIRESETARIVVTISEEGVQPVSQPPTVVVLTPAVNISITQEDELVITVQPTPDPPPDPEDPNALPAVPYDADSDATLYILLDRDDDPTNDDPANPDPDQIIVLLERTVDEGEFGEITHIEEVDLSLIPLRSDGKPYFVRATIDDGSNTPFHAYATGTVQVGQAVGGTVDLGQIGRTLLGATFLGFNPGANLGSRMITARDFDADGVDDFILVARFGNPRNLGNLGEAYLIYGTDQLRFGGSINVNSTSTDLSGVIFEGTPVRFTADSPQYGKIISGARTEGLADVATIGDLNGDQRPELLFGLPHVDGVYQGRDDDPGDDPPDPSGETIEVELVIRNGFVRLTVGDEDPIESFGYRGFEDTFIDSSAPDSNFGGEDFLEWDNDGPGDRIWALIRIRDLMDSSVIPDSPADIEDLEAELAVTVFNGGDGATVFECFTPFTETGVTFNNFSAAGTGSEPNAGNPDQEENVDYNDDDDLGTLSGDADPEPASFDIAVVIQKLLDGELPDDEVLLIIVPDEDAENSAQLRSSEYNPDPEARPTLTITYSRVLSGSAFGCYPDIFVNNFADDDEDVDIDPDFAFEALGFVALVDSDNRDNAPVDPNATRLESTSVALELAGQQSLFGPGLGELGPARSAPIDQFAQADEVGRIGGARFQAGWYDWVDHLFLNQAPLDGLFGMHVDSLPDIDNDQLDEIIISAPTNERYVLDLEQGGFFPFSTHLASRGFNGSIIVLPGADYDTTDAGPACNGSWRDQNENDDGNATIPFPCTDDTEATCDQQDPAPRSGPIIPAGTFEIFAEDVDDYLGQARAGGDFNLDGVPDILAGAPLNDGVAENAGAAYVIYTRVPVGDFDLSLADDPNQRPPMLRIRGATAGDRIGHQQELLGDVDGDRIPDIVISSPTADFGGVAQSQCAADFDGDGDVDSIDLATTNFNACFGQEVFLGDACKAFDYDNDRLITEEDGLVLECLQLEGPDCCPVDNGFVGVIFGGTKLTGDRSITKVGSSDLPGVAFYGASAGNRAGASVSSAGDFNQDGFGDLLIAAPGETRQDASGELRLGVVYLIFGGPHLYDPAQPENSFSLDLVDTDALPGIVFVSPHVAGRPNEAPPDHVGFLGDINNDGFSDIAIGNTTADFIDENLPQDPGGPGTGPSTGRRPDAGEVYLIYGNNFGSNR